MIKNKSGIKYGKLTVLYKYKRENNHTYWLCECSCGSKLYILNENIGKTKSCGCLKKEKIQKHKQWGTKIYNIFYSIKDRCYNKKSKGYKNYGGRGISMCNEWKDDFVKFYNWSINNGYKDGLSIDRIDNEKGYSPENCRWTDIKTQARNKRSNIFITYNGETRCLQDWTGYNGLSQRCIYHRYERGWDINKIFETKNLRKSNLTCE